MSVVLLAKVAATIVLLNLWPIGKQIGGSVARSLILGCVGHGGWNFRFLVAAI